MAIKLSEVLFGTFGKLRYQPTAKRVRALTGGNAVVDTFHALLVWEPQRITPSRTFAPSLRRQSIRPATFPNSA